jgi:hypothetical protein
MFSLCLIKHNAMNRCGGVEVFLHASLTSLLVKGEWSASCLGLLSSRARDPGAHYRMVSDLQ